VLVVPSRTRPNWKEQFGRVLVEAMACGVVVVGSDSGEIPHVVGEAGLIFPEGDVAALRERLVRLSGDAQLRAELAQSGRQRVLAKYTQAQVAAATFQVYQEMLT
jgi:glycosyltransferase involved in cell wall biosynthesis